MIGYRNAEADGSPDWGQPHTLGESLDIMVKRQSPHMGQKFTLLTRTVAGAHVSAPQTLIDAKKNSWRRLSNGPVGMVLAVASLKDKHIELIRKMDLGAPFQDLPCTEQNVDKWWQDVRTKFPGSENWGAYVYKTVAGTWDVWSYHAYGQALDVHNSSDVMQQIANRAVTENQQFGIIQVIYNHRVWEPAGGWRSYDGVNPHEDHVHTSYAPERNEHVRPKPCMWG
jgi:hypothetical protein